MNMYLYPDLSSGIYAVSMEMNYISASGMAIGRSGAVGGLVSTFDFAHCSQAATYTVT